MSTTPQTSEPPQRRSRGILTYWQLSRSGGKGRVFCDGEMFFICKAFIVGGDPVVVGCNVEFTPAPANPGARYRQATQAVIDSSRLLEKKSTRALEVLQNDGGNVRHTVKPKTSTINTKKVIDLLAGLE